MKKRDATGTDRYNHPWLIFSIGNSVLHKLRLTEVPYTIITRKKTIVINAENFKKKIRVVGFNLSMKKEMATWAFFR
jgi:hypothetical protein